MKKGIIFIIIGVLAIIGLLGGLSYIKQEKSYKEFVADGFIIDPSKEDNLTDDVYNVINFSEGTKYREGYTSDIQFKDTGGNDKSVDTEHFIHYLGGSLGAFTRGALVRVEDLGVENTSYYSITKNTILVKQGEQYELTSKGDTVNFSEFVWKLSDTQYLIGSPTLTLSISDQTVSFDDYLQVTYVDNGVARISHTDGTYQTISDQATITTASGQVLNLIGKKFTNSEGEELLSLNDLSVDDNSYIVADENNDAISKDDTTVASQDYDIPTFIAEDGDSGDSAADGGEGDAGESGKAGSAGTSGGAGAGGKNGGKGEGGNNGDTPSTEVKDGAPGDPGDNATTANDASDIDSKEVNIRPTVTIESVDGNEDHAYSVTSNSFAITLKLNDSFDSLVRGGETRVMLWNKETMTQMFTEAQAIEYGEQLETSNSVTITAENLEPDTKYMLIVNGQYIAADDITYDIVLFDKTFTTSELGINLTRYDVTEHSVSARVRVYDKNVTSYTVVVYKKNGENEDVWCKWTETNSDGLVAKSYDYIMTTTSPTKEEGRNENHIHDDSVPVIDDPGYVTSNTEYYAKIVDVTVKNVATSTGVMDPVMLKTLKEKPYAKNKKNADNTPIYVTSMLPVLTVSDKDATITIKPEDEIADDDSGIVEYTYEIYKKEDYENNDYDFTGLTPRFSKTSTVCGPQSFNIDPSTDVTNDDNTPIYYVGRFVVKFNNNEAEVNYASLPSTPVNFSNANSNFIATIEVTNKYISGVGSQSGHYDSIEGVIRIIDPNGYYVIKNICNDYPIKLVASGDKGYPKTWTCTTKPSVVSDNIYTIPFTITGLNKASKYSLQLFGPYDYENTASTRTLSTEEQSTYLAGLVVDTTETVPITMVSQDAKAQRDSSMFAFAIGFTTSNDPAAATSSDTKIKQTTYDEFIQYELSTLQSITLKLIHHKTDGSAAKVMGQTTIYDKQVADYETHSSDFEQYYVANNNTNVVVDEVTDSNGDNHYYLKTDQLDIANFQGTIVTPEDFLPDGGDEELQSGGYFEIQATIAYDYTQEAGKADTGNAIPFNTNTYMDGSKQVYQDRMYFTLKPQHLQAVNPDKQVENKVITNAEARTGYGVSGLSDEAVIGIKFNSNYSYVDYKAQAGDSYHDARVEYTIYQLDFLDESLTVDKLDGLSSGSGQEETGGDDDGPPADPDGETGEEEEEEDQPQQALSSENLYTTDNSRYKLTKKLVINVDYVGALELYFNGTTVLPANDADAGTFSINISDGSGNALTAGQTVLERGHKYVIAYRVHTSGTIECKTGTRCVYPDCRYNNVSQPLYRGPIIATTKEMPRVQRYLYESNSDASLYNTVNINNWLKYRYHFYDPDNAIILTENASGEKGIAIEANEYYNIDTIDETNFKTNRRDYRCGTSTIFSGTYKNSFSEQDYIDGKSGWVYFTLKYLSDKKNTLGKERINSTVTDTNSFGEVVPTASYYYSISIPYKIDDDMDIAYITSKPDKVSTNYREKISTTYNVNDVGLTESFYTDAAKTVKRTTRTNNNAVWIENPKSGEDAIVNESGFQYKIWLCGDRLYNFVALRVEVTGYKADGTSVGTVVYDPVKINKAGAAYKTAGNLHYGYALIETTLVSKLKSDFGAENIDFRIKGYYSKGKTGFGSYTANSNKLLGEGTASMSYLQTNSGANEKYYALKENDANNKMKETYITTSGMESGNSIKSDSLYIPGMGGDKNSYFNDATKGANKNGLCWKETVGEDYTNKIYKAAFSSRYVASPLGMDRKINRINETKYKDDGSVSTPTKENVTFDETGILLNGVKDKYINAEEVMLTEDLPMAGGKTSFGIGNLLSAIKQAATVVAGAKSIDHTIEIQGTYKEGMTLYARVLKRNEDGTFTTVKLSPEMVCENGNAIPYQTFRATTTTETEAQVYDNESANAANKLTIIGSETNPYAVLRLRGLQKATTYMINYYTYVNGVRTTLYSVDYESSSYNYGLSTLSSVGIIFGTESFRYLSYTKTADSEGKYLRLPFAISGADGSGITVKYIVEDSSGNQIMTGIAKPNEVSTGGGSYTFYSTKTDKNDPIMIPMNPGQANNLIIAGGQYTIRVLALDSQDIDGEPLGSEAIKVTVPNALSKPTFYVKGSQTPTADGTKINFTIRVTNNNRTLIDDKLYYTIYRASAGAGNIVAQTTAVFDKGADDNSNSNQMLNWENIKDINGNDLYLEDGVAYIFRVEGDIDLNNDGVTDEGRTILAEEKFQTSSSPSAVLKVVSNARNVSVTFSDRQRFDSVKKIVATIYNSNKEAVKSVTSDWDAADPTIQIEFSEDDMLAAGNYTLKIQYRSDTELLGSENEVAFTIN